MKLLDLLATYCYLSEHVLFPMTILKRMHYTLKYGVCDSSPIDFAGMGMILTGKLRNFQAGTAYAKYALLLLDKLNSRYIESRTKWVVYALVVQWTQPTCSALKYLIQAYEAGMQSGDTESALFAIMSYIHTSFQSGKSLETLESDGRIYLQQMKEVKQFKAFNLLKTVLQTVSNLMGKSNDPCRLTGEFMDEDETIQEVTLNNDKTTQSMMQGFRSQLFATFGRYEEGSAFAILVGDSLADKLPGSTLVAVDPFYRAISLFGMAKMMKKRKYKRHARNARKIIKSYVKKGNPNVRHLEAFLDAEDAALRGKNQQAMKHYESAVFMATRGGFVHEAALANEHFGRFLYEEMDDGQSASFHLHQAIRLYSEWGSNPKAGTIQSNFKDLLDEFPHSFI